MKQGGLKEDRDQVPFSIHAMVQHCITRVSRFYIIYSLDHTYINIKRNKVIRAL